MQVKIDPSCPDYYKKRVKRKGLNKLLEKVGILKPLYWNTSNHVMYTSEHFLYISPKTAKTLNYTDGQVIDMEKEFYKGL